MQKILITIGVGLVIIGLLWSWLGKLPIGRLPGDIVIRRENFTFYFPITTCIVLSVLFSLLFKLFR